MEKNSFDNVNSNFDTDALFKRFHAVRFCLAFKPFRPLDNTEIRDTAH
jgi:hypothetical protein